MLENEDSDLSTSKSFLGTGWRFPITTDEGLKIQTSSYEDNIKESIMIILGTRKGERVMRPDFGCGIHDMVFESYQLYKLRTY